jgi:NAD(P)-dependent dehydrogenase (short-subunit alcohol dehydrogenase family)
MKLPYRPDFSGKVAVVTGGAGVLCSMFAKALALCGAKVAILDLAGDKARALADEIKSEGGQAMGVSVNVLEAKSVEEAHQAVLSAFGPCLG